MSGSAAVLREGERSGCTRPGADRAPNPSPEDPLIACRIRSPLAALALLLAPALHAQTTMQPTAQPTIRRLTHTAMPVPTVAGVSPYGSIGPITRLADGTLRRTLTLSSSSTAYLPGTMQARPIYRGPVTAVPAGYGRYCSIVYDGGLWALGVLPAGDSDPCAQLRKTSPGGTIARAGLWDTRGENNVMARCRNDLRIYRAAAGAAPKIAYDEALGKKDCIFVISPARLPVFGLPYGRTTSAQTDANADVSMARGFDYNVYNVPTVVSMFGQTPAAGTTTAIWVDRTGRQRDYAYVDAKGVQRRADGEPAYDILMPQGKPLHAMAAGIVLGARFRDVSMFDCGTDRQGEIYIEHQVGTGEYAERFVSYYAHGATHAVKEGDQVEPGQKIGEAGHTGCATNDTDHLHLSVSRTTNLSGHRWHLFRLTPGDRGLDSIRGIIDPFGWAAPQHIDPWAWMALGERTDPYEGTIRDFGAFSIDLWISAKPPNAW
jgi:murein DD-endopeptidase MepM/ murein hydrolase activator NlpD